MPLTERDRHDAYEARQQTFGNHTDTVIELLRPDHDRLATKDDLGAVRVEMAGLRTEMADLRTEMAELRTEFRTEINAAFAAQTRTMVIGLVSAVLLIALSNTLAVLAA